MHKLSPGFSHHIPVAFTTPQANKPLLLTFECRLDFNKTMVDLWDSWFTSLYSGDSLVVYQPDSDLCLHYHQRDEVTMMNVFYHSPCKLLSFCNVALFGTVSGSCSRVFCFSQTACAPWEDSPLNSGQSCR